MIIMVYVYSGTKLYIFMSMLVIANNDFEISGDFCFDTLIQSVNTIPFSHSLPHIVTNLE